MGKDRAAGNLIPKVFYSLAQSFASTWFQPAAYEKTFGFSAGSLEQSTLIKVYTVCRAMNLLRSAVPGSGWQPPLYCC